MRNTVLLFAGAAVLSVLSVPAAARDRGMYCDDSGTHCYRLQGDEDRWRGQVPWYSRYEGGDEDYARDRHMVCDPDGDRCYLSRSWRWDYRQYYRLLGYRWNE